MLTLGNLTSLCLLHHVLTRRLRKAIPYHNIACCAAFSSFTLFVRPVVAIVDVEVEKVQLSRRNETRTKVQEHLGPADPTIVVHPRTTDELLDVELLTTSAEEYGIVVLIR